jgi:Protein of unknown function (DUF3891)
VVLRDVGDATVVCICQPAHAWISGQVAAAWEPPPDPEVVLAASQHDLGMAAWDTEPELNPGTGRPYSFLELPLETRLRLWTRAPRLALSQSRRGALLVSMHGEAMYAKRAEEPGVHEYLEAQRAFQAQLRASLGIDETAARHDQQLLAAWDWMSLVLCMDRLPETVQAPDGELALSRGDGGAIMVDPWPFTADRVEASCDGRRLQGRFEDEQEMRDALTAASWVRLTFALAPA